MPGYVSEMRGNPEGLEGDGKFLNDPPYHKPTYPLDMKIKTKANITFLLLSLAPLILIGVIAYKSGEEVIKKNLGIWSQQTAHEAMGRIDRRLYEAYRYVESLAGFDVMQDVLIDDVDGEITSLLTALVKKYTYYPRIDVLNQMGQVTASSDPELQGLDFKTQDLYKKAIGGLPYLEDVHLDGISKRWVVTFAFPVKAQFEEDKVIGVLSAQLELGGLFTVKELYEKDGTQYDAHVMVQRGDGLVIAAPEFEQQDIFRNNLVEKGLKSARLAARGQEGYLIETDEHNRKSLIGYGYSKGYRDFPGFGWFALVVQDARLAFAPLERLKMIVMGIGAAMAALVSIMSLIVSRKMAKPILNISQAAKEVAHGNLEWKINYASNDEIGSLTEDFNQMTQDLKRQKTQLLGAKAELEKRAKDLEVALCLTKELKEAEHASKVKLEQSNLELKKAKEEILRYTKIYKTKK